MESTTTKKTTTSIDGTPIEYGHNRDGSPLVIIHGSTDSKMRRDRLDARPTVAGHVKDFAFDHHGLIESTDAAVFEGQRKLEDMDASAETIGEPEAQFGPFIDHLDALKTAPNINNLGELLVCEWLVSNESLPLDESHSHAPPPARNSSHALREGGQP